MLNSHAPTDLAQLLAEAAALSSQAAELARTGAVAEALALEDRADQLRARARRAVTRAGRTGTPTPNLDEGSMPARQAAVASLNEIGVPSSPRAITEYARARFGAALDPRVLASLRRDERRAWESPRSHRPVYVVPALEGRRFLATRGKFALSDWPLPRRVIGPWSERVDHLTATVNLAEQLKWLSKARPTEAERVADVLALYAASIPGALNGSGSSDPAVVQKAARAELDALAPEDVRWREEAAARAREILDDEAQLWGAQPPRLVRDGAAS